MIPILNEVEKRDDSEVRLIQLEQASDIRGMGAVLDCMQTLLKDRKPDVALVPCDRIEMLAAATALFYEGVPFAHLDAGITGYGHPDDTARHMISAMSTWPLAESRQGMEYLCNFIQAERIHVTGSTHADAWSVDESLAPKQGYTLLHINPDPMDRAKTVKWVMDAWKWPGAGRVRVIIGPNGDRYSEDVKETWEMLMKKCPGIIVKYYPDRVSRPEYLGLLKHAACIASNSSSMNYEGAAFKKTWWNPSTRNQVRSNVEVRPGASKRIAELLATLPIPDGPPYGSMR